MNIFRKFKIQKVQKAYEAKLLQAMNAQRSGNIQEASILNEEAVFLLREIETLKVADV